MALRLRVNSVAVVVIHVMNSVWSSSAASSGGVRESRVLSVREVYYAFRLVSKDGRLKSEAVTWGMRPCQCVWI